MIEIHRYEGESAMHHQHKVQRSFAHNTTLTIYPDVYVKRIWMRGSEPWDFGSYKHHKSYQEEYFKQLKIIRAKRFK